MKYGSIKGFRNNQTQFAYQSKKLVGVITHYLVPFCKDTQFFCGKSSTSCNMLYNLQLQNCATVTFEVKEPGGILMSPVSPAFHSDVTVRIDLEN